MMRKKKRQSDQEAELARKNHQSYHSVLTDEAEVDSRSTTNSGTHLEPTPLDTNSQSLNTANKLADNGKELDLNFHPEGGADLQVGIGLPHVSMTSLLQLATLPLETYMKQNGLSCLASEQQISRESPEDKDHCTQDELDDQRHVQEQGQTSAHCQ